MEKRKGSDAQWEKEQMKFVELGYVLAECRRKRGFTLDELRAGICSKEKIRRIELGQSGGSELEMQILMSRLHVQPYLVEYTMAEKQFLLREQRMLVEECLRRGAPEEAKEALAELKARKLEKPLMLWEQYFLWKQAQLQELELDRRKASETEQQDAEGRAAGQQAIEGQTTEQQSEEGRIIEETGTLYLTALEKTMSRSEVERQLEGKGCLSKEELEMYLGYRRCSEPLTETEKQAIVCFMETHFISDHIFPDSYFQLVLEEAKWYLEKGDYSECILLCERVLEIQRVRFKKRWQLESMELKIKALERMPQTEEIVRERKETSLLLSCFSAKKEERIR